LRSFAILGHRKEKNQKVTLEKGVKLGVGATFLNFVYITDDTIIQQKIIWPYKIEMYMYSFSQFFESWKCCLGLSKEVSAY
jgi:hypothetical protein